jgi:hypothetical protein
MASSGGHVQSVDVYLEIGGKKTFACSVDWPGWSRPGRTEGDALDALIAHAPRYRRVVARVAPSFDLPGHADELTVIERLAGDASTDFGVPGSPPSADARPLEGAELERQGEILRACWAAFDAAVQAGASVELRKGPRGGGRDLDRIVDHVREAEDAYVLKLGAKPAARAGAGQAELVQRRRGEVLDALSARALDTPIARPSQTRNLWLPRYFVRRASWHLLDHAWEIEDRAERG